MSGIKISRTENENRFKKGMYPTEDDFANAFASYVHKDDMIPMSNVIIKENGESIEKVINAKADKETLETFIKEFDTVLESVRDAETGEITKTVIQDLSKRIKDAEDDIAETSNSAEKNENAIAKILSILGKQDGETVSELAARFAALSGSYATVYAFISKVKAFLESADASDETINRWQEIENFLQGITDKETLTGLLEHLKTEIKNEIPKGNFLEQVADLDGYTDAEDGKIVQYIGQTNDKYTRGFMYERKAGEEIVIPEGETYIDLPQDYPGYPAGIYRFKREEDVNLTTIKQRYSGNDGNEYFGSGSLTFGCKITIGSYVYKGIDCYQVTKIEGDSITLDNGVIITKITNAIQSGTLSKIKTYENATGIILYYAYQVGTIIDNYFVPFMEVSAADKNNIQKFSGWAGNITIGSPSSWQHIPVSPVIY